MAVLGGLAISASNGASSTNFDYDVYIKVDDTWELLEHYANVDVSFTTADNSTDSSQKDLVLDEAPTYENTGSSDVVITDVCIGAVQSSGDLTSNLNNDEAGEADNLVFKIGAVEDSPKTVVPAEIVQFTELRKIFET